MFEQLYRPVRIEPLATFRIIFGALMVFSTIRFMALGWIEDHFVQPILHFKYYGFEWVEPLPLWGMYIVHIVMLLAAIGVMIGYRYKIAAFLLFVTFTYCELIDVTYYLNHYYFVSLMCGIMIVVPAHRCCSFDVWLKRVTATNNVPFWTIFLVKFQIAIVYIYAGIAKINSSWLLDAMPLRIWLPANSHLPIIGWLFNYAQTAYVFSWAGMLYDLTIPFWLMYQPTRIFAYVIVLVFHTLTGLMFQIGIFPIVMSCAVLIFFSNAFHQKIIDFINQWANRFFSKHNFEFSNYPIQNRTWITISLLTYVAFQLVFPLRCYLYPGNMYWTEQGYRFGWRVMLVEKLGDAVFFIKDKKTGKEFEVINSEFLNEHQLKQVSFQPDLILQFAHFLKKHYEQQGMKDVAVRAQVYITMNGEKAKLYFDPQLDLTQIQDSWKPYTWLYPFP
ncbi:MAG: HTTM domain-containing protein [Cytophagales bacterium]|nr:HTTM domain-containing protein [Cytophagales bacterium]MDW8383849.1 HTTM domain-containing protein [Flammeovirgaceae bacterium]